MSKYDFKKQMSNSGRFSIKDESAFTTTGKSSLYVPPPTAQNHHGDTYRQSPYQKPTEDELTADANTRDHSAPPPPNKTSRQCPYLDKIAVLPKVFTVTQCASIIKIGLENWTEQESTILRSDENEVEDFSYRNTTQFFPPIPPSPDVWIFENIAQHISAFNSCDVGHGFEVSGLLEPPTLQRYSAPDIDKNGKPGKYDWHIDIGSETVASMRKLSYSILLNPNEYEGGQLVHKIGREEQPIEVLYEKEDLTGAMVLFPSYLLHKITEMTKGTRYSLVGWAHGNSYI